MIAAQTLHMSPATERATEVRAITQLRTAERRGCSAAVAPSPAAVATGTAVSVPAALIATAAQTVGTRPTRPSLNVTGRSHRRAKSHGAAGSHRQAGRGAALQTAAIASTHDSMLIVWGLLGLAALGACGIVAGRSRGTRWAGEVAAALVSGRGARSTLEASASAAEIDAPAGGWAPPLFAASEAVPIAEITAPEGGWAPPLFDRSETTAVEEITAPTGGWAPPLFDRSETTAVEEITAPAGGWAPPIRGLTAPVSNATHSAATSRARGRTVARWRELRAHPPTTLGVAGGAIAAILAVATKPQRAGRRHR
jgi:hypothetical protein